MIEMTNKELVNWCNKQKDEKGFVEFSDWMLKEMSNEQAEHLSRRLGPTTLMKLPDSEIKFFEWVKKEDREVWNDLWDNPEEEEYLVGMNFLPRFVKKEGRGFPICDLLSVNNYFFTEAHMVDPE